MRMPKGFEAAVADVAVGLPEAVLRQIITSLVRRVAVRTKTPSAINRISDDLTRQVPEHLGFDSAPAAKKLRTRPTASSTFKMLKTKPSMDHRRGTWAWTMARAVEVAEDNAAGDTPLMRHAQEWVRLHADEKYRNRMIEWNWLVDKGHISL